MPKPAPGTNRMATLVARVLTDNTAMETMTEGHHLVLGELKDFLTGQLLADTHDERYRQKLARLLVLQKGYPKEVVQSRCKLLAQAGEKRALVPIDFVITLGEKKAMVVKYAPGSLTTRHRSTIAATRLIASYQIPIAVVTNGRDADILDAATGATAGRGLSDIPHRTELEKIASTHDYRNISADRAEMESRLLYCFEVEGSCPCDDSICRLP